MKDVIPLSSQGPRIQGQFLLWGAFYQKQKVLMSLRNQQPETSGKAGGEALGGWRDRPSQQVSVKSDWPFPHRHCKTEAFNIARITSIHRLNLPTANLHRDRVPLSFCCEPVHQSQLGQSAFQTWTAATASCRG